MKQDKQSESHIPDPIKSFLGRVLEKDDMSGSAERDATRLLELTWGTPGELGFVVPVDPIRIAQQLGVMVYTSALADDLAGVLAKEPGEDATIVLNAADSSNRQRFTCAHELGHFIKRTNAIASAPTVWSAEDYEYVDRRDAMASTGHDPEEVYANGFAAALLMPRAEVTSRYKRGVQPFELALTFKVSPEAMRIRFETLGFAVG